VPKRFGEAVAERTRLPAELVFCPTVRSQVGHAGKDAEVRVYEVQP